MPKYFFFFLFSELADLEDAQEKHIGETGQGGREHIQ